MMIRTALPRECFNSAAGVPKATNSVQLDRRGNVVQRTDAAQKVFNSTFDGPRSDQLVERSGPYLSSRSHGNGGGFPSFDNCGYLTNVSHQTTGYSYECQRLLSSVTNELGDTTVLTHDSLGRGADGPDLRSGRCHPSSFDGQLVLADQP